LMWQPAQLALKTSAAAAGFVAVSASAGGGFKAISPNASVRINITVVRMVFNLVDPIIYLVTV